MKKKNAIMLADTRPALVGTLLLQLQETNDGLFDEAIIYYTDEIQKSDQMLMDAIIPCRFVKYIPPLPQELFNKPRFKLFSVLMFARYEMFAYLNEFKTITWLDTDILIQGDISGIIKAAENTGASLIREDPINKTSENTDTMRTCFLSDMPEYRTDTYSYCSGTIVLTDKLFSHAKITEWCYKKTVEWANNLSLPDQGVINAAIQEFKLNVTPIPGKVYCCYPYMGRACADAAIIHAWGLNKFWNDWYIYQKYTAWRGYYEKWLSMNGSGLKFEIKPRLSVIIPTYKPNTAMFRQCLDSLMAQKRSSWERFSDFEILIISEPFDEDALRELIASYDDPRILLTFNQKRLGIAASLNRGLRLAQGKYVARMDDDDLAAEMRLYKQVEYLDYHDDITLCTTDFEYFGDMNERRISFESEMSRAWSIFTCPFDHPTIMFRREFFADNGLYYDEERGYVEDWELWLRAFDLGMKVGCIHEVLFYHRWINNASAGQSNKTVDMMRELVQKNFHKLGVEIPTEDLPLLGPWNGRLINDYDIEKLESYFTKALDNNMTEKIYDQTSLKNVFDLRLAEAKTGVLPGLFEKIERVVKSQEKEQDNTVILPIELGNSNIKKPNILKRLLKKVLKAIYRPFRQRYEDRIINTQQSGWAIEGHILNCIAKLDVISAAQSKQVELLNIRMDALDRALAQTVEVNLSAETEHINELKKRMDDIERMLLQKGDDISSAVSFGFETTERNINEVEKHVITSGDKLYDLSREIRYEHSLRDKERYTNKKAVLIGTPEHSNIGDAAITVGEFEFIRRYFPDYRLVELSAYDFSDWYDRLSSIVNNGDILLLQGGGNLGSKFLCEENLRRRVISDFPENKIIILPQTIHFDETTEGLHELELSKEIYERHGDLTLLTRGERSLTFAKKNFPAVKSFSTMDMALNLNLTFNLERSGLLVCIRDLFDESGLTDDQYNFVLDTVKKLDPNFIKTNNLNKGDAHANIYRDMRRSVVIEELKKYACSKVVITDRLHGLIFSIITQTPCVVMSSYNRKIEEFCAFFSDSNAVFFIDRDLTKLSDSIENALRINKPEYPSLDKDVFGDVADKLGK